MSSSNTVQIVISPKKVMKWGGNYVISVPKEVGEKLRGKNLMVILKVLNFVLLLALMGSVLWVQPALTAATECTPIPGDYWVEESYTVTVSGIVEVKAYTQDQVRSQLPWAVHEKIENKLAGDGYSWRWDSRHGWSVQVWDTHRVGDKYYSHLKVHFQLNVYSHEHGWKPSQVKQLVMEAFREAFQDNNILVSYEILQDDFHYCLWAGAQAGRPGQKWTFQLKEPWWRSLAFQLAVLFGGAIILITLYDLARKYLTKKVEEA